MRGIGHVTAIYDKPNAGRNTATGGRWLRGTNYAMFVYRATADEIARCPENPFAYSTYTGVRLLWGNVGQRKGPKTGDQALEIARELLSKATIHRLDLRGFDVIALIG